MKWFLSLFMLFHCSYSQAYMDTMAVKSSISSTDTIEAEFKCKWVDKYYSFRKEKMKHYDKIAKEYNIIVRECCECGKYMGIKSTQGARPSVSSSYCETCVDKLKGEMKLPKTLANPAVEIHTNNMA